MNAFLGWISSGWPAAGVALGLLFPFVVTLTDLCGAAEVVFGITLLGALIGAVVGAIARPSFRRPGDLLLGMSLGFAAAFFLTFVVGAQYIDDLCG